MFTYDPDLDVKTTADPFIVNTVNTVGKMGKGVALDIKERFPWVLAPYQAVCTSRDLLPGKIHVVRKGGFPTIINMATKEHYRDNSKPEWVGSGLIFLSRYLQLLEERAPGVVGSVTLPPPGCGNGGLDWADVHHMARSYLQPLSDLGIRINFTRERPENVLDDPVYAGIGSRKTPLPVLEIMTEVGRLMAREGVLLRSGGAEGADSAFEAGADGNAEIFLPWAKRDRPHGIVKDCPVHLRMALSFHPFPHSLKDAGRKLMARNGCQIFGENFTRPSHCVICWTPEGLGKGGTGQALRLARTVGIPVIDLGSPEWSTADPQRIVSSAMELIAARRSLITADHPLVSQAPSSP